jgi:hypothetical protein
MNQKENRETNNSQIPLEDLTVNQEQAADAKGGGWGSSMYQYGFADPRA